MEKAVTPPAPILAIPPSRSPAGSERPAGLSPYLAPPKPEVEVGGNVRMLTVVLRSTGDKTRDVLRIRRIHGVVSTNPGNDRFAIHVFERGKGIMLEFPNVTVGLSKETIDFLVNLLGADNVRVEIIKFQ